MTCPVFPLVTHVALWRGAEARVLTGRAPAGRVQSAVAAAFRVRLDDLRAAKRGSPRVALARQVAMYLAHVECGLTFAEVGQVFGRARTTAARACRHVEDLRTDSLLDAKLLVLERKLRGEGRPAHKGVQ